MTSIRRHLLVGLLGALTLTGLTAATGVYLKARDEANTLFDYQLNQIALSLRDHAATALAVASPDQDSQEPEDVIPISGGSRAPPHGPETSPHHRAAPAGPTLRHRLKRIIAAVGRGPGSATGVCGRCGPCAADAPHRRAPANADGGPRHRGRRTSAERRRAATWGPACHAPRAPITDAGPPGARGRPAATRPGGAESPPPHGYRGPCATRRREKH